MLLYEPNNRVLMFSQRNIDRKVYQCLMYEFEDIISEIESVDLLTPEQLNSSKIALSIDKLINKASRTVGLGNYAKKNITSQTINQDYELFFSIFLFPSQLLYLNSLKGWKENSKKKACFLGEVWTKDLENQDTLANLKLLKDFDHIFLHTKGSLSRISEIIERPCYFMPVGIDALKFCPYPSPPQRVIDVYSMGRRSDVTHQALLGLAESQKLFYLYDTTGGFSVIDYKEHRSMSANIIKRSKYFIAYKHNTNLADSITGGQEELGARLFEGIAGGAVLLGIPPACDAYEECFDWQDAVIEIPFEETNINEVLSELEFQSERVEKIRQNNIINALRRHDWVYRWEKILETVGMSPMPEVNLRKANLEKLSKMILHI